MAQSATIPLLFRHLIVLVSVDPVILDKLLLALMLLCTFVVAGLHTFSATKFRVSALFVADGGELYAALLAGNWGSLPEINGDVVFLGVLALCC